MIEAIAIYLLIGLGVAWIAVSVEREEGRPSWEAHRDNWSLIFLWFPAFIYKRIFL